MKKILIVTQVVDLDHPILGFFHRWIEEFAKHYDEVHVIALLVGRHSLPASVTVHSLGKEAGGTRLTYLWHFYRLIWSHRYHYDEVFVHMNQIYVVLGGVLWRLLRKRVGLWYAHGAVSRSLRLAIKFAHVVFTSTPQGLQVQTTKKRIVGQGIDTSLFAVKESSTDHNPLRLIVDGRISVAKHNETLLQAVALLKQRGIPVTLRIVGTPLSTDETAHGQYLRTLAAELGITDETIWHGGVGQAELATLLKESDLYIQDSATGSFDKSLIQAVMVGLPTFSSNTSYVAYIEKASDYFAFTPRDATALTDKIIRWQALTVEEKNNVLQPLTTKIRAEYSIDRLITDIVEQL